MTTAAPQTQAPAGGGLRGFIDSITWARPRRRDPVALQRDLVAPRQPKPRPKLTAETLAESYIGSLRPGSHVYRVMKDAFDGICEEAEIEPISDKRFATWVQAYGGVRYRVKRDGVPNVTMYEIAPRRHQTAA